jgi:hypothetical protein
MRTVTRLGCALADPVAGGRSDGGGQRRGLIDATEAAPGHRPRPVRRGTAGVELGVRRTDSRWYPRLPRADWVASGSRGEASTLLTLVKLAQPSSARGRVDRNQTRAARPSLSQPVHRVSRGALSISAACCGASLRCRSRRYGSLRERFGRAERAPSSRWRAQCRDRARPLYGLRHFHAGDRPRRCSSGSFFVVLSPHSCRRLLRRSLPTAA